MTYIVPVTGQIEELRRTQWRPKLRAGYFFIKDRQFYLYARKRTILVRDTIELKLPLAGIPDVSSIQVSIEGVPWTNWRVVGRDLYVSLLGLEGSAAYWAQLEWDVTQWDFFKSSIELLADNQIYVSYDFYQWNSSPSPTGQKFDVLSTSQYFRISDAEVVNKMPADYVRGAPVVITDDTVEVWDARKTQMQFRITEPSRLLEFNMAPNRVHNPHFASSLSGQPRDWYVNDAGIQVVQGSGYVGRQFLQTYPTGRASQDVGITAGHPIVVESWVRGSGVATMELAYRIGSGIYDPTGAFLGTEPNFGLYSVRATGLADSDWSRLSLVLGYGTSFDPVDALYPDLCDQIEVRLGALTGVAEWGAIQLRYGWRPGQYGYVSMSGTIEYEIDPSGFHRPHSKDYYPYEEEWNPDANSVNDESHGGFLVISEDGEVDDVGLGIGEMTFDEPGVYGELLPTGYPQGVWPLQSGARHEIGRRHLPYAMTRGQQKLRQTQIFDLENQQASLKNVTEPRVPRDPSKVLIASPASMYRDGSGEPYIVMWPLSGRHEFVAAMLRDTWGNPIVHDWIDVIPSGNLSVDPSGAYTNRGGRIVTELSGWLPTVPSSLRFVHKASGVEGRVNIDLKS
jgi:hypothetical protein